MAQTAASRIHYSETTEIEVKVAHESGRPEAGTVELVHTWCRGSRRLSVALVCRGLRYSVELEPLGDWPEAQHSLLAGLEGGLRDETLRVLSARLVTEDCAEATLSWPLPAAWLARRGEATLALLVEGR